MQALLIKALMSIVARYLTEDLMKELADKILDFVEEKVEQSENKIDDATVLPVLKKIREAFDIED